MICAPDSTHRPCDCGADSPNCEVCDEQWPCAASAEAAIARVRALHKPCIEAPVEEGGCKPGKCDWRACMADGLDWPCNTIRALDG